MTHWRCRGVRASFRGFRSDARYAGVQTTITTCLGAPTGIAVHSSNAAYFADTNNARILKETPSAAGYTQATPKMSL